MPLFLLSFLCSPSSHFCCFGFESDKYTQIECMHHWIHVCVCVSLRCVDSASLSICLNLILHDRLTQLFDKRVKKKKWRKMMLLQLLVIALIRTLTNPITVRRVNKNKRLRKHNFGDLFRIIYVQTSKFFCHCKRAKRIYIYIDVTLQRFMYSANFRIA